jgi:hypothetical protein
METIESTDHLLFESLVDAWLLANQQTPSLLRERVIEHLRRLFSRGGHVEVCAESGRIAFYQVHEVKIPPKTD